MNTKTGEMSLTEDAVSGRSQGLCGDYMKAEANYQEVDGCDDLAGGSNVSIITLQKSEVGVKTKVLYRTSPQLGRRDCNELDMPTWHCNINWQKWNKS